MQERITEVHQFILSNIKATNSPDIKEDDVSDSLVEFQRLLTEHISRPKIVGKLFKDVELKEDNDPLIAVCDQLETAIFAKAYKTGRCGEMAAIAFIELLKKGIQKSIEVISSFGILHDGETGSHQVVLLDRDAKASLTDAKSLANITVVDSWWKYEPKTFSGKEHPSREDLASNYIKKVTKEPDEFVRFDRNLTSKDCQNIITFLGNLKKILTLKYFETIIELSEHKIKMTEVKEELDAIHSTIDKEIACFKSLALNPPTVPKLPLASHPSRFKPIRLVSDQTKSEPLQQAVISA